MPNFVSLILSSLAMTSLLAADSNPGEPPLPPSAVMTEEITKLSGPDSSDVISRGHTVKDEKNQSTTRVGKWTTYVEGLIVQESTYNNQGELHGPKKLFFPNGAVMILESYENGLRHGLSEWYSAPGVLSARSNFRNGKLDGEALEYGPKGSITKRVIYKNGKAEPAQ